MLLLLCCRRDSSQTKKQFLNLPHLGANEFRSIACNGQNWHLCIDDIGSGTNFLCLVCYYELPFTGTQHNFAYMEWYLSNISFFLLEARQWMYSGKTCRLSAYICLSRISEGSCQRNSPWQLSGSRGSYRSKGNVTSFCQHGSAIQLTIICVTK